MTTFGTVMWNSKKYKMIINCPQFGVSCKGENDDEKSDAWKKLVNHLKAVGTLGWNGLKSCSTCKVPLAQDGTCRSPS